MNKKSYCGKWVFLGIDKKERDKIRNRIRQEAKHILSQKYLKEFKKIKKKLLNEEYNKIKSFIELQGGLKKE